MKSLYRGPFDWLESWSTGCSDSIVVNSNFTKGIFAQAFPALRERSPRVVYPCVDISAAGSKEHDGGLWNDKAVVLSINRFEKKKDVGLAVRAYAKLTAEERKGARLVVAGMLLSHNSSNPTYTLQTGGYDPRVAENVSYHQELCALADSLGLQHATHKSTVTALATPTEVDVVFLLSIPNAFKSALLSTAKLLVYTPLHEHFGIVPLEAMLAETPVLAANEGGPTETVVNEKTGWLRNVAKVEEWSVVTRYAINPKNQASLNEMGKRGRERVVEEFSKERMAMRLDGQIRLMLAEKRAPLRIMPVVLLMTGLLGIALAVGWMGLFRRN